MAKLPNPVNEAAAFVREAQRELAQMRDAMKAAEDSVAGLSRAIKDPVIRTPRTRTKRSVSNPSPLLTLGASIAGGFIANAINPDSNSSANMRGSFYTSAAQSAARLGSLSLLGQRIS